jgi:hypothetical protein
MALLLMLLLRPTLMSFANSKCVSTYLDFEGPCARHIHLHC